MILDNLAAPSIFRPLRQGLHKLTCFTFGHSVNNHTFATQTGTLRECVCGITFPEEAGARTRVRHTLSCFFLGHTYTIVGDRDGHREFVCDTCGHPLLFKARDSPYAGKQTFHKQVRYLCNLFGHTIRPVAERCGLTEYACRCGHSFLIEEKGRTKFRHPPACTVAGHYIHLVENRGEYAEYRCGVCGHPFCFIKTAYWKGPVLSLSRGSANLTNNPGETRTR